MTVEQKEYERRKTDGIERLHRLTLASPSLRSLLEEKKRSGEEMNDKMKILKKELRSLYWGLFCSLSSVVLFGVAAFYTYSSPASAKRLHLERWYQEEYCKGIVEYRLPDRTRVDCLLEEYAVEYDFAGKWAEAIGQSLHYGRMTQRKPGIVLIMESPKDEKYYKRLMDNIRFYDLSITVWLVGE